MKRLVSILGVLAALFFATGCSINYKAVGVFDDSGEIFVGDLDHNLWSGRAQIVATSLSTDTVCRGHSRVTHVPMFSFGCAGQEGVAPLVCSDGRRVTVDWVADSCSSGTGYGTDQMGNTFSLAFGFDEAGTMEMLSTLTGIPIGDSSADSVPPAEAAAQPSVATGTGFFITETGVLVTNYHVVDGSSSIVVIYNGESYPAVVLKVDASNDVAILKIEGVPTQAVPLAGAAAVERGEDILVLGYPLSSIQGTEQKATVGRVNALSGIDDDIRFIQIDAPIQPGNSGGPLFNARGEVVGIVTAGLDAIALLETKGVVPQNVGYALKVDYVWPLLRAAELAGLMGEPQSRPADMPELIRRTEHAVTQVYAKQ